MVTLMTASQLGSVIEKFMLAQIEMSGRHLNYVRVTHLPMVIMLSNEFRCDTSDTSLEARLDF